MPKSLSRSARAALFVSLRCNSASNSACSLKAEERLSDGGKGADTFDKLVIAHLIRIVDVDVEVFRQDAGDDLEILVRLYAPHSLNHLFAVRGPVFQHVSKECLAKFVA